MSKVKPLLPGPVALARRVLAECHVRSPRDLNVEVIAAKYGAMVLHERVETAWGCIVRSATRAIISVDETAKGTPRGDFTTAHELGHFLQHTVVDHFAQCFDDGSGEDAPSRREQRAADAAVRLIEREANHFAVEMRMPEPWAAPLCAALRPGLEDIERLSRRFSTSFTSSAYRFLELTRAPCALVHSVGGRIRRSTETEAFPGRIVQRRALHPACVAAGLQGARAGRGGEPREVPGEAWGDAGGGFVEHAVAWGEELGVWSWIVKVA